MSGSVEPRRTKVDSARYRQVLGHYPTGVVVIAAQSDGGAVGVAIGSFTSLSLDPPLVLFCVDKGSGSWPIIEASGRFCVNVLAEDQEHLSRRFGGPLVERFVGVGWHAAPSGSPIIDGILAWIDCEIVRVEEGGDHWVVIARVMALDVEHEGAPLVFFRGGYGRYRP